MVTLSGQIPGNYKLKYQLAEHTDEELQAARRIHMAANSSRTPGSGLIPQQQIYRVMPPYQTLANPDHATEPTRYSHMHLNGLPASQSAAASPLGFLNNKLMAFGQSGTLNGRNREESELRDELLHDITGLDTVEYLKVGRPARLKLPPVAILTFRTEKDAAAAYTYRAQSVPLVPLHQHAPNAPPPAGHLSIRKHAEQQQSYADRSLAVVRASSPDFVRKDKHACLQLLIKQTTHLYTQFGPNSPELNAFEFAEAALGIKPYQADYVHVQCTSVPGVHGLLAMDTIAFGTGLTVTFSAPLNHDAMAPSKTVDAFSLMVHEVSTGAAFGDVGNSLVTCIEQSAGCTLAQADHTGAKAVQVQGVRSKWSKLFLVKAATREDFLKVLELNGAQTFGPSLLKISTAASSLVGQSSYRDPNQAQAVRSALKSNSTYSQISHQAHLTNQPTAVSQAAPVVGMKEVLIRLDKMQQQNHSLEGEIRKVGTAVHESKSDVLQAVHAGTAATGEVFTAIQAVADTQTTESGATQLQLQAMSKLSKKVDSLGGKVDQVSTNLVAATGVASKKTCQSIQEEMSLLRKQMNILSPTNPREKHAKIAIDNAHPVNLEAVYPTRGELKAGPY